MARLTITIPTLDRKTVEKALKAGIRKAAIAAAEVVKQRTARGTDMRGAPFRPYSAAYALAKRESGRNTSPPDLTLTGQMLRAMRLLKVEGLRAIIGFEGQHRVVTLERIEGAWAQMQGPRKAGRLVGAGGKFATEWVRLEGKGRKLKGSDQRAGYTTRRSTDTVSMAAIVTGNQRTRPFFGIERDDEIDRLVRVANAAIVEELRKQK